VRFGAMTTRFFLPNNRKLILELATYLDVLGVEEGFKLHYIPKCMEIKNLVRLLFQVV
jgi:hypothetical protein